MICQLAIVLLKLRIKWNNDNFDLRVLVQAVFAKFAAVSRLFKPSKGHRRVKHVVGVLQARTRQQHAA